MGSPLTAVSTARHGHTDRQVRLLALSALLQEFRDRKEWSIHQASQHAGIGHMAWGRAEQGVVSRGNTYAALDHLFGLYEGTVKRATTDDEAMAALARHLGVDTGMRPASAWVREYAAQGASLRLGGLSVSVAPSSDADAVREMVQRIRGWGDTDTNTTAVVSLLDALERRVAG
jgi:hypothetical protein